jgi:ADP-ribosyl-[dinitrogen reductase] hydrolase
LLLHIAIGDAYGAGFEFCSRDKIVRHNTLASFVPHELGIAPGCYTDDTQMSIAVSEVLLAGHGMTSEEFADAFVRCYRRDPRQGYAKGLQGLLADCETGPQLRSRIRPGSRRNGAAMRSVPLGLLSKSDIDTVAQAQAQVTHDTPEGILSSRVVAYLAHAVLYDQVRLADLAEVIDRETGFRLRGDWDAEVKCDAIETLHAVHTALLRNTSMSQLLVDCVNFSGDVDSVAAIALGIASLSAEYVDDVPMALRQTLESGAYGQGFLDRLDASLAQQYPSFAAIR